MFGRLFKPVGIDGDKLVSEIRRGFDLVASRFHIDLFLARTVKAEKADSLGPTSRLRPFGVLGMPCLSPRLLATTTWTPSSTSRP